jgi:hypothetical protein
VVLPVDLRRPEHQLGQRLTICRLEFGESFHAPYFMSAASGQAEAAAAGNGSSFTMCSIDTISTCS